MLIYFEIFSAINGQRLMRLNIIHVRLKFEVSFKFPWIFTTFVILFHFRIRFGVILWCLRYFWIFRCFDFNAIVVTAQSGIVYKIDLFIQTLMISIYFVLIESYIFWMVSNTSASLLNVCERIFLMPSLTLSIWSTPSTSLFTNVEIFNWLPFSCSNFSAATSSPNAFARSHNDDLLADLNGAY